MATALVKVQEKLSPYHQAWRGFRIVCAHPNMAGHKPFSKEPAPSFNKPYLIVQFGDYEDQATLDRSVPLAVKELNRRGFDKVVFIDKEN